MASLSFVEPPPPVPASAPADQFSADRAFAHVDRIGAQVHAAGSAGAAQVRDYIVTTLTGFGLQPRIQDAVGATGHLGGFAMARVRNVIAVLPGQSSTDGRRAAPRAGGRVFLVAHLRLGPDLPAAPTTTGPGASLLETARAMTSGPNRNDIVFVFTDAPRRPCVRGGGVRQPGPARP